MEYGEAVVALANGKKIRCCLWLPGQYLMLRGLEIVNEKGIVSYISQNITGWDIYEQKQVLLSEVKVEKGLIVKVIGAAPGDSGKIIGVHPTSVWVERKDKIGKVTTTTISDTFYFAYEVIGRYDEVTGAIYSI